MESGSRRLKRLKTMQIFIFNNKHIGWCMKPLTPPTLSAIWAQESRLVSCWVELQNKIGLTYVICGELNLKPKSGSLLNSGSAEMQFYKLGSFLMVDPKFDLDIN
ncbi:hypothetical protein HanXRQr2_Chr12g0536901 [Helianthus annuus]|uniref:Uncharacterized protein n=1 Tax=Helianthus annuus TaxID=4232 RepID=A0A251SKC2_HELAN|nr:uncharacterized protein LOC110904373 [Helianthus annuus]KAF5777539.1 hypothetical protein HanXRQr2_Chr12g0536901 [Helianthus annuus]KAJ0576301.1 hypothetical protein HanIR_Chr05g0222801 [Helianthus annuus]